uniref:Secreted protein n=1 Tax=Oryza brachyantha TaxID=4533 RepID=J3M5G0_ORYBR
MLQRLGMVMATSGLIPAALAVLDSMTAHRQLGLCPMVCTAEQQLLDGADCGSSAAETHGASRSATLSAEALPHSPAPSASAMPAASTKATSANTAALIVHYHNCARSCFA